MNISEQIASLLISMIERDGLAEIQRKELADRVGCVPSQINYVIASRFTPERGYTVESRRGEGGYIRIRRIYSEGKSALFHAVASVGDSIDEKTAYVFLINLRGGGVLREDHFRLMLSAVTKKALTSLDEEEADVIRADILRQMLKCIIMFTD